MLPICFGQATKVSGYLLDADKVYRVTASFGAQTDTADADGTVIAETANAQIERKHLERVLAHFRGEIEQIPPMYSALKRDGRRLYELAREGKEVPRDPRRVHIRELEIDQYDSQQPVLRVQCSKGTYIRTLIEDIARAAGTLGHVAALRRLAVFPFREEQMVIMPQLEAAAAGGSAALCEMLLPVDEAIGDWPSVYLTSSEAYYLLQGHPVRGGCRADIGLVRLYGDGHRFLGIGEVLSDGRVAPKRLLVARGPAVAN